MFGFVIHTGYITFSLICWRHLPNVHKNQSEHQKVHKTVKFQINHGIFYTKYHIPGRHFCTYDKLNL